MPYMAPIARTEPLVQVSLVPTGSLCDEIRIEMTLKHKELPPSYSQLGYSGDTPSSECCSEINLSEFALGLAERAGK